MISTFKNMISKVAGANDPYNKADEVSKKYADAINTQYAAGIQNLQDQQKGIAAAYDPQRASVNAQYERGVRNNNEQMANLGLTRSGTNLTQQMALETERQRGITEVNTAQAEAAQKLQAQINEYMAERDAAIGQQSARLYENTYNMEQQFAHDKEMAAISHRYNQQMAALEHQYNIALATNNHALQLSLEKEMAALEQDYKIATLEKQAELDNASYAQRAATDWNYRQQEMALANKYETGLLNLKNSSAGSGGGSLAGNNGGGDATGGKYTPSAKAVEFSKYLPLYGYNPQNGSWTDDNNPLGGGKAGAVSALEQLFNSKGLSEDDLAWLITTYGL